MTETFHSQGFDHTPDTDGAPIIVVHGNNEVVLTSTQTITGNQPHIETAIVGPHAEIRILTDESLVANTSQLTMAEFGPSALLASGVIAFAVLRGRADQQKPDKKELVEKEAAKNRKKAEIQLSGNFEDLVGKLSVTEIIQLAPGAMAPKGLEKYSLTALRSGHADAKTPEPAGSFVESSAEVAYHYGKEGVPPYLDTSLALGLVYKGTLSAISAACIDPKTGALVIKQIQNVNFSDADESIKNQRKNGLWGGFLWRNTLVQGWLTVAEKLNLPLVEIQSARNNRYRSMRQRTYAYDDVATAMGFATHEPTGNYRLSRR